MTTRLREIVEGVLDKFFWVSNEVPAKEIVAAIEAKFTLAERHCAFEPHCKCIATWPHGAYCCKCGQPREPKPATEEAK